MKKLFVIVVLGILTIFLTGCYNFSVGITNGQLIDIKLYLTGGEELEVEIIESSASHYFKEYSWTNSRVNLSAQKLNSPRPVWLYYTTVIEENSDVVCEFQIKENYGRIFDSITINEINYKRDQFDSEFEQDGFLYITLILQDIHLENQDFNISDIFFNKQAEDESITIVKGTTWVEGRTYINGVYFYIENEEAEENPEL